MHLDLRQCLLTVFVLVCVACNSATNALVDDTTAPQNLAGYALTLTALGDVEATCAITSVGNDVVGVDVSTNSVGMALHMSDAVLVDFDDATDTYTTASDTSAYTLTQNDTLVSDVEFAAFVSSPEDTPARLKLFITGIENPETDTIYVATIAANSITCEDGTSNSSAYELEFTVLHLDIDSSCNDESCGVTFAE